ncbi:MAG TPA: class I SAM-dependent methyltransferase [Ktedonobacteraceae bacterium]|nr:class I SAM-dependent methyltransferase [Ktedonobacteraceae bacterium]
MNQADTSSTFSQQDQINNQSADERTELERIIRIVAHSFEGNSAKNLPRLEPFVNYFRKCINVLDVGCGEGLMLELLGNIGTKATGIDIDPLKIATASSKGLEATKAEAHEYLHDKIGVFDGIFLRHIIEHFDGPDGVLLLHLCRKALQSGGIIIVITPNFRVPEVAKEIFWLDITHRRPYPLPLLQHIFAALELDVVEYGTRKSEKEQDLFIVGQVPK